VTSCLSNIAVRRSDLSEQHRAPDARRTLWHRGFGWLSRRVSLGAIGVVLAVAALAVAVFVGVGGVDVSADKPDGWTLRNGLHFVFKRSMALGASSLIVPADIAAPSRIRLAAQHFDMVCANCHGRPGFGQSMTALSMSPRPQYLPKVIGQFTDAELHVIVDHGVKFSAMPSWPTKGRGDEVWTMVSFLRQLPRMDARSYLAMTAPPAPAAPTVPIQAAPLRPADARRDAPPADEFLYAAPAFGFSDGAIQTDPTVTCARCHGVDGSGAATGGEAPNLTLQDAAYLRRALEAYTRGGRKSGFMQNIAAQLSEAQIIALADHYAALPVKTFGVATVDPAVIRRGEAITLGGVRERAIPACASCHESEGARISGAPRIAGQSAVFLRRQLSAMADGGRGATLWWNPMPAVAHQLGASDIAAVAAYYSQLKPSKAAGVGPAAGLAAAGASRSNTVVGPGVAKLFADRCMTCHIHGGRGDLKGEYPDLTIQAGPFVAQSLYAFRTRARPNAEMREVIDSLSFDEMTSLAAYVHGLAPRPALVRPDPVAAARGAAIALNGAPARGVPACLGCHGAQGVDALPLIPRLQGQNAGYLRNRLDHFAEPFDVDLGALNPMPMIAGRLTKAERADLAAYFAAAAPIPKPTARR
jgi:cytochrome c553